MSRARRKGRRAAESAACALGVLLCTAPATARGGAKGSKRAVCAPAVSAHERALEDEKARRWMDAREGYTSCAAIAACAGLAARCQAAADRLSSTMPTIVPVVTDERGEPRVDVRVTFDGRLLTSRLDGTSLPVDGGLHELTYATDKGVFARQRVLIVESQRNRLIAVSMATDGQAGSTGPARPAGDAEPLASAAPAATSLAPGAPAATEAKPEAGSTEAPGKERARPAAWRAGSGPPVDEGDGAAARDERPAASRWTMPRSALPYVLGGAGVLAVAGGALLTAWGNGDMGLLRDQCRPYCPPSSVDHVRALYVAADIAYGAGAAALAVTTFLFAGSRTLEPAPRSSPPPFAVDVRPVPAGAFATVAVAF